MDFSWNEEQIKLREKYASFGETVAKRSLPLFEKNEFDEQSWKELCQTDFWEMIIPREYGGKGDNWWDFTAAIEGIASRAMDSGFLLTLVSQLGMVRGLSLYGTEEQKQKYFPKILGGDISATAIAEPHTGTDIRSLKTTAHREGENFRLSGEKWNIAHAPKADFILVVSKTPGVGKSETTLFLVDKDTPGLERGEPQAKMGNRTLPTSWLKFHNIELSEKQVLGAPGKGLSALINVVSIDRLYYSLTAVTLMEPLFEKAIDFIHERSSFQQKLKDLQYVQNRIVEMKMGMEKGKWLSYVALDQLLTKNPEAWMTSSIAKLAGSESFITGTQHLQALFGSNGYLEGEVSRMVRDALGFMSVGGTMEMHKTNIFNQLLRLHQEKKRSKP